MNENMTKWVEALRSMEYKQGKCRLKTHGQYCCLGVACELYRQEYPTTSYWNEDSIFVVDGIPNHLDLPVVVQDWLGVFDASVEILNGATSLTGLNDSGLDFLGIAAVIEGEFHE